MSSKQITKTSNSISQTSSELLPREKLDQLSPAEQVSAHFYLWELLGRGWMLYSYPVDLEPTFMPFLRDAEMASAEALKEASIIKAKKHKLQSDTEQVDNELIAAILFITKIIQWILIRPTQYVGHIYHQVSQKKWYINSQKYTQKKVIELGKFLGFTDVLKLPSSNQATLVSNDSQNVVLPPYHEQLPFPKPDYGTWVDLDILLPDKLGISLSNSKELLRYIASSSIPVSYEIIAKGGEVSLRLSTPEDQAIWLQNHLELLFPNIVIRPSQLSLRSHVYMNYNMDTLEVLDFGYTGEWMLPIRIPSQKEPETLLPIMSLLDGLEVGDTVIFQVMCQGVVSPWQFALMDAVTGADGKPFFVDAPEFTKSAQIKASEPFLASTVRVLIQCMDSTRRPMISEAVSRAISQVTGAEGIQNPNRFDVLAPKGYKLIDHFNDFCNRSSRRTGMLMNISEVVSLFHFPPPSVRSKKMVFNATNDIPVPSNLKGHQTILGTNSYLGKDTPVTVSTQHRLRHMHIVGATGSGKSTFLLHLMKQDIKHGNGFAILDPHGDTIESIIPHIPKERISDVVLIDPSDSEYPVGFNMLSAKTEVEKIVLSSDITGLFRRFATSWGDQMEAVLANTINVLLEHPKPQTLLSLRKFLVNTSFRKQILDEIDDDYLLQFWLEEFKLLRKQSVASIITRLDTFLRPKVIRSMMEQTKGVDVAECINTNKILLVKLSQGLIGEQNAHLLGSLFTAKLYQAAQGRQAIAAQNRNPFFLYIDEFQHFVTPSMEALLSGARKFGLGLVLAHQDLHQLTGQDTRVANSLLSNAGIRVCFRVGDNDAKKLESGFTHFEATDLQKLDIGHAIVRVGSAKDDCNMVTPLVPTTRDEKKNELIQTHTRNFYSNPLEKVSFKSTAEQPQKEEKTKVILADEKKKEPVKPIIEKLKEQSKPVVEKISKEPTTPVEETVKPIDDFEAKAQAFKEKAAKKLATKEHSRIQKRVQQAAHTYQFKADLEYPVEFSDGTNSSKGRVDVAIFAGDVKIACEISVTNSADYEVKNIKKCFSSGFDIVLMCSQKNIHLQAIQKKAKVELTEQQLEKIVFGNAQDCIETIHKIAMAQKPKTQNIRGYRVKVNYNKVSNQIGKNAKDMLLSTIINAMRK